MNDRLGQQLGNYRLIRHLGKGGFAVVYLGEHVHLKTLAAIKVLHQVQLSSEEEAKFRAEACTIANLKHAHIIRVLDYGIQESTGTPFLVMDYAPKETLRRRYSPGTRLSPHHILPYVTQVASALQYAHDRKVIHRDVKPENMLLDENDRVRLSDFGIAVVYETSRGLNTLDKSGTPPYMAPEQFLGKPLPVSDQYSLGIVVYEWLCGVRPFQGTLGELLHQHESVVPPLMREKVPSLSPEIEEVIQKSLAKNPEDRYASVWDFAMAFQAACQVEQAGNGTQRTIMLSSSSLSRQLPALIEQAEQAKPIAATPPDSVPGIWNIPYRRNIFFTGRQQVLNELHDAFFSGKTATQTQAISGLGGMGKTQVAVEYAYRYYKDYRAILWVRGDTREKMQTSIVALAGVLKLEEQHEKEQQHVIEAVRAWLRKNSNWLLIVDNIEDLKLVRTLLPATAPGHILLTTRTQTTGNIAQRLDLEKMTLEEGALFLLRRTKMIAQDAALQDVSSEDCQEAQALAAAFAGLPLALDQAGAYIEEAGCSLANYLCRYQAGQMKLLGMRGGFAFDHPASVTTTFSATFEKIEKISPTAMELFRFCAFLHPDGIPEGLIVDGAAELGPTLQCVATDPISLDETIVRLRKFSLVNRNAGTNKLSVHPLVQTVLQNSMGEKTRRMWAERTVRAVNLALPDISDFSTWHRCQLYMPHVQRCVELIEEWKIVSPEAARLLEQAGMYLQAQARHAQANTLFERTLDMRAVLTEITPAATVASLSHLFWYYHNQGQYAQAEQPIRQAFKLLQQTPEVEQQLVAVCLGAIAHLCYRQGKYSQAEEYFLQALTIYEKRVGLQHPSVVCTFKGLGDVSLALGKYDLAERFFWDALNLWKQMPEPQHPLMGDCLNSLVRLAMARGKYAQAELYLQQERAHLDQTLQYPHPALASNLNDRALLCIAQGKYKEVEPLLREALTTLEQSVGLQHPIAGCTLDTLGRLAYLQGEYVAAEQFFQRAQRIREQALGVEHPDVLTTVNNLADTYMKQSKLSVAEELYKDVLAARTRILGEEHPAVAQTLQSMAQLSYAYGQYIYAEELYKKALTIREKVLKSEHPDLAQSLYGLALLYYWKWKRFDLAEIFLQRALSIYINAQLLEHPDMAQFLKTYASLLLILNRKPEAVKAMIHAKAILDI
jgi:serine/threonine protein kinase/tetratricopeptide (TPR) repeat protein